MENLLTTGFKSDLTIVVGGKELKVHKLILQAGSQVLYTLIEKCESRLELEDCKVHTEIFEMFLKYLYTGESNVNMEHAMGLLQLASEFDVSGLTEACLEVLKGDITSANVIQLFNQAMLFAHKGMISGALGFICRNGQEIVTSDTFKDLRLEGLVEILQQDGLRVRNEIGLFNEVYKWGEAQLKKQGLDINPVDMRLVLAKPLKHIRFPLMDSKDFGKVVAPMKLLDSEDTISLLTSFVLPLEERGNIHGSFSLTSREYTVEEKVVVYRAGCWSKQVLPTGGYMNCESLEFCASKDGKITGIGLSEGCFDDDNTDWMRCSDCSELKVKLRILQKRIINGTGGMSISENVLFNGSLPLTQATKPALTWVTGDYYGYLVAILPTPVEFSRDTWILIELTLQGFVSMEYQETEKTAGYGARQSRYTSPYKDVFHDKQDPTIQFQFRRGRIGHGVETGLLDHIYTVLKC